MANKEIVVFDSQRLASVQSCGYKYHLTFERDLIPVEKQRALEYGDLIHRMLQTYYTIHKYRSRWPAHFSMKRMIQICERVAEYYAPSLELELEDVEEALRTFREYVEFYWGERLETIAVEQVGSKVMYEDDNLIILYESKIDWIVSMANVKVMCVDHKTYSRRDETLGLSNQFMGYCWMTGTTNLMVNKIGKQKTIKPKEKFLRPIMSYPPPVLEEWRRNAVYWIKEALRWKREEYYPKSFTSCKNGSNICIFRTVCEAPLETRLHTIHQLFEKGPKWDVGSDL
jgi:hypothetical protein